MDGLGMSLFNGAGSIHVNTSLSRKEEEEALEEERLRKEELHNELNKHFDDFEDDEEETMDDSSHFVSISTLQNRRSNLGSKPMSNLQDELRQSDKKDSGGYVHRSIGQGDGGNVGFHQQRNGLHQMSNNTNHHQHCYQTPTAGHYGNHHHTAGLNTDFQMSRQNDDQLQFILETKCREVQKLTEELSKCRKESSTAHDDLYGRLAVAEAERERAQLSLQQSKELVENSRHRITELEHEVATLKQETATLTLRNDDLNTEVKAVTASLMDTQNRLQMAHLNKESAHNTDALFKALHERHNEDLERLEKDLMKTRKRLQDKENECYKIEKRFQDVEHSKEALLIEKGSTINQLAMELKETQDRLADMGERSNQLISERNTARLQCKDLAHKFEETAKDLVEYRTKCIRLQEEQSELDEVLAKLTDCEESDSFTQLPSDKTANRFSAHADKVELLRIELSKRIVASKMKDSQIQRLNKSVQQKDLLLEQQKESETRLLSELEELRIKELKISDELKLLTTKLDNSKSNNMDALSTYRNKCFELETELKQAKTDFSSLLTKHTSLELKYEELNSQVDHKNSSSLSINKDWIKEKEKFNHQLKDAQTQVDQFKNLYVEICGERDKLTKEISELKSDDIYHDLKIERSEAENLRNNLENERKKVEKLQKALLESQKNEFDTHLQSFKKSMDAKGSVNEKYTEEVGILKKENENLIQSCEDHKRKLNDMTKELEEAKNTISKLKIENELQGERDRIIADLKEKGKQFEKYIQNQKARLLNRRDIATSTDDVRFSQNVSEIIQTTLSNEDKENQITNRSEEEIRNDIARQFAVEINRIQNQLIDKMSAMEQEYKSNIMKLSDVLKVKTREVTSLQEVIISERGRLKEFMFKMKHCQDTNANNEKILSEYKSNVEKYKQHIVKLNNELKEINKQKNLFEDDRLRNSEAELSKLKEKYKILKKCTVKYKEYNAEKDKHVEKELDKMKKSYESRLKKMQEKLEKYLSETNEKSSNSMESINRVKTLHQVS